MLAFPSGDGLVTAARVALFFALIFSYPVLFHPTRATINALVVFVVQLCTKRIRAKKKGIAGSCNSSEADEGENLLLRPNNDEKPPSLLCVNNQMVCILSQLSSCVAYYPNYLHVSHTILTIFMCRILSQLSSCVAYYPNYLHVSHTILTIFMCRILSQLSSCVAYYPNYLHVSHTILTIFMCRILSQLSSCVAYYPNYLHVSHTILTIFMCRILS